MSTTSLKLSDELKRQAVAAAQDAGVTPHEFMVDAIRQAVVDAAKKAQFIAEAKAARAELLASGLGYDAQEVHAHLRDRLGDPAAPAPKAKPWRG
ncbi:hypothetical protein HSX11_29515 [Oxalobacteraceae bacterium]|nr:hypothetical protein [Oxalobacteraceae bacterium]